MTRADRRRARVYLLRLNARRWWQSGWNQIWTIAVLYALCLCFWLLAIPPVYNHLWGA